MKPTDIAKNINLVCLVVDGVLTNGSIVISGEGELFKEFYVRDGLGIKFLQDAGIQVAICTGRTSTIVTERAKELGITLLMQGQKDKRDGLADICARAGVKLSETAYMGDDIPDLCLFPLVALSAAPSDAVPMILREADWISAQPGGRGAVRELAEFILEAQDKMEYVVRKRFNTEI